jgi:hypothetical protein
VFPSPEHFLRNRAFRHRGGKESDDFSAFQLAGSCCAVKRQGGDNYVAAEEDGVCCQQLAAQSPAVDKC